MGFRLYRREKTSLLVLSSARTREGPARKGMRGLALAASKIMSIIVRRMSGEDSRAFLEVHHAAVRGIAIKDYSLEVIEDWAPSPISMQSMDRVVANPEGEIRLVAEQDGTIVGIGALILSSGELRGCYVAPTAAQSGVGSATVREIEQIARKHGVRRLHLNSSVTAEPFYLACGYSVCERGEHTLTSGRRMACIKMQKIL